MTASDGEITSLIGPGWADNMALDTLTDALRLNAEATPTVQGDQAENFWASTARMGDDPAAEVMEWTLTSIRLVNHITFDVSKYPCDVDLECFDEDSRSWQRMRQDDDDDCRHEVLDCYPAVIPYQGAVSGGRDIAVGEPNPSSQHPQHNWPDHWDSCEWTCRPVRCQRLRLVLKRHTRSRLPCDTRGRFVPYSCAVRKVYCGYKIDRRDCVPRPVAVVDSVVEHEEFATASDLLGSNISYSIRINRASNVLLNTANVDHPTQSVDATLIWRSEPQPFPWAVVNYYMDIRDLTGEAQTLDRIFLDPTNDGANVNLYWSNDEPASVFEANDSLIPSNVAVINGQFGQDALSAPDLPYDTSCWVEIDNGPICYRPHRRWWFGARCRWRFNRHDDVNEHPFFDCGDWHVAWTRYGLRWGSKWGDYCYVDCDDFDPGCDFDFACWHDGERVRVRIRCRDKDYFGECRLTVKFEDHTPRRMRFCRYDDDDRQENGDCNVRHAVLKCDEDFDDDRCHDFFIRGQHYVVKPEFAYQDLGGTNNALLRYFPDFAKTGFPSGFKGGDADRYKDMEWSPIARNFILRRGFLQFAPTKAKYWKLEFCDLVPEPYEVYVPIKRTVKTYRTEMWLQPTRARTITSRMSELTPGVLSHMDLTSIYRYLDNAGLTIGSGAQPDVTGATLTSARIVVDASALAKLRNVSWSWCFTPCHRMVYVPRFETKQVHSYTEIDVEQTTKIAYFVGLKAVQPYKVDYLSVDDTNQYWELFQNTDNIASETGWELTSDHTFTSGAARYAEARSKVMPSARVVRAVQFATTQSSAYQLLPDDDFDDEDHEHWLSVGDGALATNNTETAGVGSTLRVDRASRIFNWGELVLTYSTWGTIEDADATWTTLEGAGNPASAFGGIESLPVTTPPGGRIYAAARVIAPAALTSPLYVQIVDAENDRVLAESPIDVQANQVTEWYTGYTLGEGGDTLAWRWADFATNAVRPVTMSDNFARVNGALGTLTSGQTWLDNGSPLTIASAKAVSDSTSDFSYVDGITPWGSLQATLGTTISGFYVIDCQPFRVSETGQLAYRSGANNLLIASNVFGRTLISGDTVQIDVLPTTAVPVGKLDTTYADAAQAPYSLVFWLNGVWTKTVAHGLGARTQRGLRGGVGQQFTAFAWIPATTGQLVTWARTRLPLTGNGTFSSDGQSYTDTDGDSWSVDGSWDPTTAMPYLVATVDESRLAVDTEYWYGHLSAYVINVATGAPGMSDPHGALLVLDADADVTLTCEGRLTRGATNLATVVPGGIGANTFVEVSFLDTKAVTASVIGSISPTAYPKVIVFRTGGVVRGYYPIDASQMGQWTGTRRGLAGDAYRPGVDGSGNPLPLPSGVAITALHTAFSAFGFAPDASTVPLTATSPTWDQTSRRGTGTYDEISHFRLLNTGSLKARVVQRNASIDVWNMDALSLYADPIVWSFSNDGGSTFYDAYDIRNNPNGVLVFPDGVVVSSTTVGSGTPGQSLVWRVVAYSTNRVVSSLTIRPWYGGLLSGITHRTGITAGGPNVMPYDHYPSIEHDARFQTWNKPIPQDWWYQYRIIKKSKDVPTPLPELLMAPEALTSKYWNEV